MQFRSGAPGGSRRLRVRAMRSTSDAEWLSEFDVQPVTLDAIEDGDRADIYLLDATQGDCVAFVARLAAQALPVVVVGDEDLDMDEARRDEQALTKEALKAQREREREARRDSVDRSRSTLSGQVLEKLAPHFPEFPYDPTDLRFLGTPVDYIVFDGLAEGDVQEIVFLEVKSGRSALTTRERRVRDAVEAGAVRWDVYRVPDEG